MEWMAPFVDNPEEYQPRLHENIHWFSKSTTIKGYRLYRDLMVQMNSVIITLTRAPKKRCGSCYKTLTALKRCITKDVCKYLSYDTLYRLLFKDAEYPVMYKDAYNFVKKLYMQHLGITDERTLEIADRYKLSGSLRISLFSGNRWFVLDPFRSKRTSAEDKAKFKERKKKEAVAEQKCKAKEARQKKFEQEEGNVKWDEEDKQAFKSALGKKFSSSPEPNSNSQNQVQNHENSESDK